ncbi:LIC_10190 family membrane protein [Fibrella aquatilis]|uniref:DUF8201 domain-containing protein n=1 Tax=Fibrella aquatilis TaxID=2817059 RepID=A0A939GDI2_9BACT|nr:hypothetical protein [Fibrella aquatilis]MBO0934577.1 hypothetical protein [Fibrella aquatilis]
MLFTLVYWLYITLICYLAGQALLTLVARFFSDQHTDQSWPLTCLLGAAALTTSLGYAYLWTPINGVVHAVVVVLLVGYAGWKRPFSYLPDNTGSRQLWPVLLALLSLTILIRSTQLPRLNDTGGYHAPMIEWIRHYAVVPGLANLNYRFGFNNSWFLLNAFFAWPLPGAPLPNGLPGFVSPWHGLNGWLLLLGFALAIVERKKPLAWLWGGFMVGLLLIFHWTLASPTPDLPAQLYAGLVVFSWLRHDGFRAKPLGIEAWLCLFFGLVAMTTKLSTVTVLALPALLLLSALRRRSWRYLAVAVLTIGLATGYWWAGNIILSGYLFYPSLSPLADLFSVDWKVPRYLIEQGLFNLTDGTKAGYAGPTWHVWAWVPHWFATRPLLEQATALLLAGVPVAVLFGQKSNDNTSQYTLRWAIATATLGVLFWFLLAPDLRFGAASVLLLLLLSYAPLARRLAALFPEKPRQRVLQFTASLLIISLLFAALKREPSSWLLPTPYPNPPLTTVKLGSQTLYIATDRTDEAHGIRGYWSNCYAAPLPCAPYVPPGLRLRGKELGEGFRMYNAQ